MRLSRRRFTAATLGAAASSATWSAPLRTPRAATNETLTIRFGFASIGAGNRQFTGANPAATMHIGGYAEREFADQPGVKIAWYFFAGAGPAVNEALANGQLDFAQQGDLPSVVGRANGLRTRIIAGAAVNTPIYLAVVPGSDIKRVADLRGKSVGLRRGTNLHLAAAKVLAANGLTERDIKIVSLDLDATNAALAARTIDAAVGSNELFDLERQGLATIVYSTKGDDPAFSRQAAILVTESFERDHPDAVATLIRAHVRAAAWASDEANREALFEQWTKSGYSADSWRREYAGEPLAYRNSPLVDPWLIGQYQTQAAMARDYKLIRREVSVDGWFNPDYVNDAVRQLGDEKLWTARDANGRAIGA